MKRVYVAGAYSADNVIDVLKNIGKGESYALEIFIMGFAPFCPWHDKQFVTSGWDYDFTIKQFYNYSIAWLKVSDIMYVIEGYEKSKGTLAEIEVAMGLGIPIIYDLDELAEIK